MHVLVAEPLCRAPGHARHGRGGAAPEALARLIDRLQQRLGAGAVCRLHPAPEPHPRARRSRARCLPLPACGERVGVRGGLGRTLRRRVAAPHPNPLPMLKRHGERETAAPRPLLLLPRPEAAEVVALIPEGPPRQFRWRGVLHQVAEAQGPERIAPEWWRRTRRGDARLLRRRGHGRAAASGSTAPASTAAATPPRTGSCTGCSDERAYAVIPGFMRRDPARSRLRRRAATVSRTPSARRTWMAGSRGQAPG